MTLNSTQKSSNESSQELGSKLCVECGLCCRSVVVTYAVLRPGEVEKAERLGLSICKEEETDAFNLPCAYHVDGKCSIYEDRFRVCKKYQCEMLKRLLAGEVDLEQALETVRMTQALEEEIYALLGTRDSSKGIWDLLREFFATNNVKGSDDLLKKHPALLLKVRMLSLVAHKYFEPDMDTKLNSTIQPVRAKQI